MADSKCSVQGTANQSSQVHKVRFRVQSFRLDNCACHLGRAINFYTHLAVHILHIYLYIYI